MFKKTLICVLITVFTGITAYSAPPTSPPTPGQRTETSKRIIIPAVKSEIKRNVSGSISISCSTPPNQVISSVVYYIDDKEVGRASATPFTINWNSATASNGEHIIRWSGLNENNKEVASGSMIITVSNKSDSTQSVTTNTRNVNGTTPPNSSSGEKPVTPTTAPMQWTVYGNEKHKIWFEYPLAWTVKDQSSTLGKDWPGGYWFVVSTDPVASAEIVINIRHKLLSREHTSESFLKYNSYLTSWDQTDISGRDAFTTTDGTPALKRVVHRAIILEGRHCWMLRCIDTSGKPDSDSRSIFMRIAESLSLTPKQAPPIKGNGLNQIDNTKPAEPEPSVNPPQDNGTSPDDTINSENSGSSSGENGNTHIDDPDANPYGEDGGWPTE